MKGIDTPSIMDGRTPEQNIQAIKGWAYSLSNELNYQLLQMESEIESLKKEVEGLKEAQNGGV